MWAGFRYLGASVTGIYCPSSPEPRRRIPNRDWNTVGIQALRALYRYAVYVVYQPFRLQIACSPTVYRLFIALHSLSMMFASAFFSRLTSSANHTPPLLPLSASPQLPYTDVIPPSTSDASAALRALARQEAQLQSHIQYLLDVQSERLLEGLGEGPQSPSQRPQNGSSSSKLVKKTLGLGGARQGIKDAISSLYDLKAQNADVIESTLETTTEQLHNVNTLQDKKRSLEAKLGELDASPSSSTIESQEKELRALDRRIYDTENKLYEMRARQRVLRQSVQEGKNKEEARASSYRSALEMAEEEERHLVAKPTLTPLLGLTLKSERAKGNSRANIEGKSKGGSVWDLPPKRRTLEMVSEHYKQVQSSLNSQLQNIETEQKALEDGGSIWEEVVDQVSRVENILIEGMQHLGKHSDTEVLRANVMDILSVMDVAKKNLERDLGLAEEKDWKLIMVCVGAELEALRQGERLLRKSVGMVEDGEREQNGDINRLDRHTNGEDLEDMDQLDQETPGPTSRLREETDTDDEPGPDLLISR